MRIPFLLALAFTPWIATGLRADGLITRLPADSTWALYTANETITDPDRPVKKPLTVTGTLKIASVGSAKVNGEPCRWIELVLEANQPGAKGPQVAVFKALIPEKFLAIGQDPRPHWIKGWMKLGDQPPMALTPEQLAAPVWKLNLYVCGPLQETKDLQEKEIDTALGKLTCKGVSGTLVVKDGSVSVKNGQVDVKDLKYRLTAYFHPKAPFGVASLRIVIAPSGAAEQHPTAVSEFTLSRVGTKAQSALSEQK
jgi:hypothetical protein